MDMEAWHAPWGHKESDTTERLNWIDKSKMLAHSIINFNV